MPGPPVNGLLSQPFKLHRTPPSGPPQRIETRRLNARVVAIYVTTQLTLANRKECRGGTDEKFELPQARFELLLCLAVRAQFSILRALWHGLFRWCDL